MCVLVCVCVCVLVYIRTCVCVYIRTCVCAHMCQLCLHNERGGGGGERERGREREREREKERERALTEKSMFFLSWLTARGSGTGSVCLIMDTDSPVGKTEQVHTECQSHDVYVTYIQHIHKDNIYINKLFILALRYINTTYK